MALMQAPAAADPMIHTQAIANFYNSAVQDDVASQKAGRPIFVDEERVRIVWAGNTKSEFHAPAADRCDRPLVNPEDKSRYYVKWKDHPDFKPAYEAFKAGQAYAATGTPITELPFLSEANRMELKAINVLTAEQLVGMDISKANKFGIGRWREQAKSFLDRAAGAAVDAAHAAEKQDLQDQLDEMRAQIAALASGGGVAPKAAPQVMSNSPFAAWEPEDIRLWITDTLKANPHVDMEPPHSRLGKPKLLEYADDLNARVQNAGQSVAA
jgi:hypothetical protein